MEWRALAQAQHGVLSRAQLEASGLTRARIESLRRRGELVPDARRGVWRIAAAPPTRLMECWSAVLATGGVLSHGSAARLWGISLPASPANGVSISIPHGRRLHPLPEVRIHRIALVRSSVAVRFGLPVTSRATTVMDCLRLMRPKEGALLLDRALQQSWLALPDIDRELAGPRRVGNPRLRDLREQCALGDAESERVLHRLLRRHRITGWEPNAEIDLGFAVLRFDVVFPRLRLIIEVDGWASHGEVDRFQSDRTRQNAVQERGWDIRRFTWHHIVNQPDYVVATIRAALRSRERATR
jgi:very-short-patch-repair endonuclease